MKDISEDYEEQDRIIKRSYLELETLILHFMTYERIMVVNNETKEVTIATEEELAELRPEYMSKIVKNVGINKANQMVEIHISSEF